MKTSTTLSKNVLKAALLFTLFACFTLSLKAQYSQQWVSTLNSPGNKTSVLKDASDNLYTFGGNKLAKFNSAGTQVWSTTTDYITAMALDNFGNIYVTGSYDIAPNGYVFVKKFSNRPLRVSSSGERVHELAG